MSELRSLSCCPPEECSNIQHGAHYNDWKDRFPKHMNSALISVTWGKGFHRCYHKEIFLRSTTREETSVPTISLQMSLVLEENAVEDRARDGNSVTMGEGIQKPPEAIRNLQWFLSRLDSPRDLSQVSSLLWNSGIQNRRDHSLVFSMAVMVCIDCQLDRI